jgi:branched-chain amino acid transport system permease protein
MIDFLSSYATQFDLFLLAIGFAYSQQVVLRAGVFSIATAGYAAIGAYAAAIMVQQYGIAPWLAIVIGTVLGTIFGALLAIPLARLRGVYQAIATLAFVQIVVSVALYAEPLTGGAMGINNIPRSITTWHLLIFVAVTIYVMWAIDRSGVGRVFDAVRQDEVVGATLGVSIVKYQMLAFAISGLLGGLFGALQALYVYSIEPEMFGFPMLTAVLTYIILGGRGTVLGPIVGAAIIISLPEIARPLADYRPFVNGILMMLFIAYLPHGIVDTIVIAMRKRRAAKQDKVLPEESRAIPNA